MNIRSLLVCLLLFTLPACGLKEREQLLRQKEKELTGREQDLLLREQAVTVRESELNARQHQIDSTSQTTADTAQVVNTDLPGRWQVKMTCTETNCEGSAIGDTKNEQWDISYENDKVVAKAYSGKNLIRIYNGSYQATGLELTADNPIYVNLHFTGPNRLEGTRQIQQPGCKIVYTLVAEKR
jgi:hypothetical protein